MTSVLGLKEQLKYKFLMNNFENTLKYLLPILQLFMLKVANYTT